MPPLRTNTSPERKLYPNVDFYSGIILRGLSIPVNMFPVMFAIGRMPGWIAHWYEDFQNPAMRIHRPRQIYTGARRQPVIPMNKRKKPGRPLVLKKVVKKCCIAVTRRIYTPLARRERAPTH